MSFRSTVFLLVLCSVSSSCGPAPEASSGTAEGSASKILSSSGFEQTDETRRMVERLRSLAENEEQGNPFDNHRRVERLRRAPRPVALRARVQADLNLALELLRAGQSKEAAQRFSLLLENVELLQDAGMLDETRLLDPDAPDRKPAVESAEQRRRELRHLLAIAYLRVGEQENCLLDHRPQSCLVPIVDGGRHHQPEGSKRALELYGELLSKDPEDSAARWLYNLAAMTLGLYPEEVPPEWRVDPRLFESEMASPATEDVASSVGADVLGLAGGVVFDDLDGDGLLDIFASSWGLQDPLVFLRNGGDGRFLDRTREAGLEGLGGGLNLTHADYDNDGDLDILVLRGAWLGSLGRHPPSLLRNRGDGRFDDVTESAGLLTFAPGQAAAWADMDLDGDLDLFMGHESTRSLNRRSELFLNRGDGTFEEIGRSAGLNVDAFVKGCAWGDVNNDGLPDLYISTMGSRNLLLINRSDNASGTRFVEVGQEAGVDQPLNGFPTWFWDFDNDGALDIFAAAYGAGFLSPITEQVAADYLGLSDTPFPKLYRNLGDGTFRDVTGAAGLERGLMAMGANFGDLDNDGFPDLYVGTGAPNFMALAPNRMFLNGASPETPGRRFYDVGTAAGMGHIQKGHGVAFGDWDGDGDQDVYAVMGGAFSGDTFPNALFQNPGNDRRWITLRLRGTRANHFAVGARVRVHVETPNGTRTFHHVVSTGGSFGSNSLQLEIGLGDALGMQSIEVDWPSSTGTQVFLDFEPGEPALDRVYYLREGDPSPSFVEPRTIVSPKAQRASAGAAVPRR